LKYKKYDPEKEDYLCRQVDYHNFKRCLWFPSS
jgi:hypothetical protein